MTSDTSGRIIDMTPDGRICGPARGSAWPIGGLTALVIAAGALVLAVALLLWVAVTVLPVLLAIATVLYLVSRLRSWRRRHRLFRV